MAFKVRLTKCAETDLLAIYEWISENDDVACADHVLDHLEAACLQLETMPERGHVPAELERIQVMDYREVHWKPYRIIYQISGKDVHVLAVLDGRRDLEDLLMRRLLS
jgi:toxin ParE1/3/4